MIELKKNMLAVLTPLMIFSLAPAVNAGNEPVKVSPTTPTTNPAVHTNMMDRPEMAPFKRIQMLAVKFRQKLSNMQTMLDQAKRTGAISADNHKKLQAELVRLNDVEPSMARGGWNQKDVDAFDKQVAEYEIQNTKAHAKGTVQFSAPAATESKVVKPSKGAKVANGAKNTKDAAVAPAKK